MRREPASGGSRISSGSNGLDRLEAGVSRLTAGDTHEPPEISAGQADGKASGRYALGVLWHAYPQRGGQTDEPQGRSEHESLAVETDGDRRSRVDLERRSSPLAQTAVPLVLPGRSEREQPCEVRRTPDSGHHDAEAATVHAEPRANAAEAPHLIRVVRDDDHRCVGPCPSVGTVEAEVDRLCLVRPEHRRQRAPPGSELCLAVRVGLDDLRVQPKRRVVDEDVLVHAREVYSSLEAVRERVERSDDVVPVQAEIEREV